MSCLRVWVIRHSIFVRLLWFLLFFFPPCLQRPEKVFLSSNVSPLKNQSTQTRSEPLKWDYAVECTEAQLGMALSELSEPDPPPHNSNLISLMSSGWCHQAINQVPVMRYWKMGLEKKKGIWQIDSRTGELRSPDLTIGLLLFIFFPLIPWMLSHNKACSLAHVSLEFIL